MVDPGAQHPAAPDAGLGPVDELPGAGRGQYAVPAGVERRPELVGDPVEFGAQAGPALAQRPVHEELRGLLHPFAGAAERQQQPRALPGEPVQQAEQGVGCV